jgi:glycosyltransferase involved in cell wall biosynthesis
MEDDKNRSKKPISIINTPKVSVILPTYNRAKQIENAVQSVLSQTYKNYELIVIDDGSTDSTEDVLRKFTDNNRFKYFKQVNQGASVARNFGLEKSKGELIAFQDSDDKWREDKLEKQVRLIESQSEVGLVYSDMLRVLDNHKKYYLKSPTVMIHEVIDSNTNDYQVFGMGMVTVLVKRSIVEKVGGFDTRLPRYIDLDWFVRIAKITKCAKINEPLVEYHQSLGITSDPSKAARARQLLLEKHKNEIICNKKFYSMQLAKISTFYWKAGDKTKAQYYAKKSLNEFKFNMKVNFKLFIVIFVSNRALRILPKYILDKV